MIFYMADEAQMAESVDALVSNTSGETLCRFDPGSGYFKPLIVERLSGVFFLSGVPKSVLPDEKKNERVLSPVFSNLIFNALLTKISCIFSSFLLLLFAFEKRYPSLIFVTHTDFNAQREDFRETNFKKIQQLT